MSQKNKSSPGPSKNKLKEIAKDCEEFTITDGRTFLHITEKGRKKINLFQDFSIAIVGELKDKNDPLFLQWVLLLTTPQQKNNKESVRVLLEPRMFECTKDYLKSVRRFYPKGNGGKGLTNQNLKCFLQHIIDIYICGGAENIFYRASSLGYQGCHYWIFSSNFHYLGSKKLSQSEQNYIYLPHAKEHGTICLNPNEFLLTDIMYFKETLQDFYKHSSKAFQVNSCTFMMAISYAIRHLLRLVSETNRTGADESKYALLTSTVLSCGKSTAQKIIIHGLGSSRSENNPLFIAGGNMRTSGTSVNLVREILTLSNMVVCIDDIHNVKDCVIENLMQLHNGLSQGSKDSGLFSPESVILFSSNEGVPKRLVGRVITLPFRKCDNLLIKDSFAALTKELMPLVISRKGFLVAWVIHFYSFWEQNKDSLSTLLEPFIQSILIDEQPRLQIAWTNLAVIYILFQLTCGEELNERKIIKQIKQVISLDILIDSEVILAESVAKIEKATACSIAATGADNVNQWLKTDSTFTHKGRRIEAVAFKANWITEDYSFKQENIRYKNNSCFHGNTFFSILLISDIKVDDLKTCLELEFGKNSYQQVHFDEAAGGNKSKVKAYKIPKSLLSKEFVASLSQDSDSDSDSKDLAEEPEEGVEETEEEFQDEMSDELEHVDGLIACFSEIQEKYTEYLSCLEVKEQEKEKETIGTSTYKGLSPARKRKFMGMTVPQQYSYLDGYNDAQIDNKRVNNKEQTSVDIYTIEVYNMLSQNCEFIFDETHRVDSTIPGNTALRKEFTYAVGVECRCYGFVGTDPIIIEGQQMLVVNPERKGHLLKLKITGIHHPEDSELLPNPRLHNDTTTTNSKQQVAVATSTSSIQQIATSTSSIQIATARMSNNQSTTSTCSKQQIATSTCSKQQIASSTSSIQLATTSHQSTTSTSPKQQVATTRSSNQQISANNDLNQLISNL